MAQNSKFLPKIYGEKANSSCSRKSLVLSGDRSECGRVASGMHKAAACSRSEDEDSKCVNPDILSGGAESRGAVIAATNCETVTKIHRPASPVTTDQYRHLLTKEPSAKFSQSHYR